MTHTTQHYLELLEQRIALLGSLAHSLSAASTGLVSFDIEGLESRIAEQERLCSDLRVLDGEIDRVQRQCVASLSSASGSDTRRLRETAERLSRVQSSVKQLNDAHQLLLRRSRRTVSALLNSYHSFAMTYSDPAAARASAGEGR